MSIDVEVEFHLRLPNHTRDVGAVLVAAAQHGNGPVRTAYPTIHPTHAAEVHIGYQAGHTRQSLNALEQQLAQLRGGPCRLSHHPIINIGGQSHGAA